MLHSDHGWSLEAGISWLGHLKIAEDFPGKQLRWRISLCIRNRLTPYLYHITCIGVEIDGDNRTWLKQNNLCKREGNKPRLYCYKQGCYRCFKQRMGLTSARDAMAYNHVTAVLFSALMNVYNECIQFHTIAFISLSVAELMFWRPQCFVSHHGPMD